MWYASTNTGGRPVFARRRIRRASGEEQEVPVTLRIDTPIEIEYYRHGGILPFVLRQLIAQSS